MNRATFFKHFELLADQPDAVVKLRELVLQLAVQGKVVTQNPKDESAEILITKVRTAKERLTKELRIKELTADLPIKDEDKKPALPRGWAWVKLADLCLKLGAGSTPLGGKQIYEKSGVKFLRSQNVYNDGLHLDDVAFIPPAIHKDMSGTWVQPGDILLNITGASIGRSAIVPDDFDEANVSQHVAIVRLAEKALRQFLHLVVIAPDFQQRIMDVQVGVSREGLSMTRLKEFVVAIPPLAEQRRIVAKVDELMALCDELEQRQQARQHASGILQQSALHHLLAAREPQTFAAAWQRVRAHFHLLHDTPDAIPQLRQAILQLAVQGRLVPQNPKDEPAISNLEVIENEKRAMIEARKLRPNLVSEIPTTKTLQYEIPKSWRWFRLGDVAFFQEGPGIRNWQFKTQGIKLLNVQNIVDGKLVLENTDRHISKEEFEKTYQHFAVEAGDILFASSGASWGKTAWFVDPGYTVMLNTSMVRLKFYSKRCDDAYLLLFLRSAFFKTQMEIQLAGIQPNFGSTHLGRVYIPIPPLAEQKRIVARVEELLRWCDTLESQLHQTRTLGANLLASTLHHLLAA